MHLAFIQGIGPLELVIVLVVVLLVFGPKRLPALARSAGAGIRELKSSIGSGGDDDPEKPAATALASAPEEPAAPAATTAPARPVEADAVRERR